MTTTVLGYDENQPQYHSMTSQVDSNGGSLLSTQQCCPRQQAAGFLPRAAAQAKPDYCSSVEASTEVLFQSRQRRDEGLAAQS